MSLILAIPGRAQFAGYAGLAGSVLRGRARPLAIVAAVDVLAVALAFGALHIAGVMVGGSPEQALVPPANAATEVAATVSPAVAPFPRLAPVVAPAVFAAMPDATTMFGAPVLVGTSFSGGSNFSGPPAPVLAAADPIPSQPDADPRPQAGATPPVAKIASIALRARERALDRAAAATDRVIDTADGSLDRLLTRDIPATVSLNGSGASVNLGSIASVAATRETITASADVGRGAVAGTVQQVTQPVSQVVSKVTGLLN